MPFTSDNRFQSFIGAADGKPGGVTRSDGTRDSVVWIICTTEQIEPVHAKPAGILCFTSYHAVARADICSTLALRIVLFFFLGPFGHVLEGMLSAEDLLALTKSEFLAL